MLRLVRPVFVSAALALLSLSVVGIAARTGAQSGSPVTWTELSSADGDLPAPGTATNQVSSLIVDIDSDGVNDFVIGMQREGRSVVWYRYSPAGWTVYVIEDETFNIEAGGTYADVDGDGDFDVVMGTDHLDNKVWWWENPYPNFDPDTPWTRRVIKGEGEAKHHDQLFGDFDNDGQVELAFWNQKAKSLMLAEIPADPLAASSWSYTPIFTSAGEGEGLGSGDVNGDGTLDLLGAGYWFEHTGGTDFVAHAVAPDVHEASRITAGDLVPGGNLELVMVPGDGVGALQWFECGGDATDPACWVAHDLLPDDVHYGHSLELADFDEDGHLDIFVAEMGFPAAAARMWIFYGDGAGGFTTTEVASDVDNHESKVGDLDGDGDLDILAKPYNINTPGMSIWINELRSPGDTLTLDSWQRHELDPGMPWRAVFVAGADLDGDADQDVVAGGWWFRNPGQAGGTWERQTIGAPLHNMAALYDFDGDGDVDILGTDGQESGSNFAWAENDGSGGFTLHTGLPAGQGDFLQGVAVARFASGGPLQVALSWHEPGNGVQMLTVPADPAGSAWTWAQVSPDSLDEALSLGDIDRDGDLDLLQGTNWLRNDGGAWSTQTLYPYDGHYPPDRNRLADLNGDGRLDAVIGTEANVTDETLLWFEQGPDVAAQWTRHVIADLYRPLSVDVADMDRDGDLDVIAGEHNVSSPDTARLIIFENADGQGTAWTPHVVYTGDEHHDGAQVVDIDGDGDLDIVSISWGLQQVVLYENLVVTGEPPPPPPPPPTPPAPVASGCIRVEAPELIVVCLTG